MALVLQDGGALAMLSTFFGGGVVNSNKYLFLYTANTPPLSTMTPQNTDGTSHVIGAGGSNPTAYQVFGGSATVNAASIVHAVDNGTWAAGGGVKTLQQGSAASTTFVANPSAGYTTHGVTGFWDIVSPTTTSTAAGLTSIVSGIAQSVWTDYTFTFTGMITNSTTNQTGVSNTLLPVLGYGIMMNNALTWGATEKVGYTVATNGFVWFENFNLTPNFTPQNNGDTLTLGLRFKLGNITAGTNPL